MKKIILISLIASLGLANEYYYEFDKKVEIKNSIQAQSESNSNNGIQKFTTNEGRTIQFKNEIIVQCKKSSNCEDDFEDLSLQNYSNFSSNYYLIKLENNENIFEVCRDLYSKDDIKSAHPNYIKKRKKQ